MPSDFRAGGSTKRAQPAPFYTHTDLIFRDGIDRVQLAWLVRACVRDRFRDDPALQHLLVEICPNGDESMFFDDFNDQLARVIESGDWDVAHQLVDDVAAVLTTPSEPWDPAQRAMAHYSIEYQRLAEMLARGRIVNAAQHLRGPISRGRHRLLEPQDVSELCQLLVQPARGSKMSSRHNRKQLTELLVRLLPPGVETDPARLSQILWSARRLHTLPSRGCLQHSKYRPGDDLSRTFLFDCLAVLGAQPPLDSSSRLRPTIARGPLASVCVRVEDGDFRAALQMLERGQDEWFSTSKGHAIAALLRAALAHYSTSTSEQISVKNAVGLIREFSSNLSSSQIASLVEHALSNTPSQEEWMWEWQSHFHAPIPAKRVRLVLQSALLMEALVDPYAQRISPTIMQPPNPQRTAFDFPADCYHIEAIGRPVWTAEASSDGFYVASSANDDTCLLTIYEIGMDGSLPRKKWSYCPPVPTSGHTEAVAWHPSLPFVAAGTSKTEGFLWSCDSAEPLAHFYPGQHSTFRRGPWGQHQRRSDETGVGALAFLPSQPGHPLQLLCGWLDGTLELIEFDSEGRTWRHAWQYPQLLRTRSLSVTSDVQVIVLGAQADSEQQLVRIDARTWTRASTTRFQLRGGGQVSTLTVSKADPRTMAVMSSQGLQVLSTSDPILSVGTGISAQRSMHFAGPVQSAFVVPVKFCGLQDKFVLCGTESRRHACTFIFNRFTGKRVATLAGHTAMVNAVAWARGHIVTGSDDGTLRFYRSPASSRQV